ncbi:hypothetical protein B0H13DRAFT_2327433 [Mycena leptocephala]|nr:hypothetical protein B0H13DRAFT_2327433 [Mycena leptocephala]
MSRPDVPGMKSAWGGVAAVIRTTVPFKLMTHLCAPDLMVLDLHHLFLVGAYLLPGASAWREWTKVDPQIKLTEVITTLSIHLDKPLLTGGDLNARIGERIPSGTLLARTSSDPIINTCGWWLLRLCSDTSMTILNGTTKESNGRSTFTLVQPLGSSVIDYCFVSSGLIPRIAEGAMSVVKSPVWSDHAQIQLTVVKPESRWEMETPIHARRTAPILFNNPTPLDLLLKATLEACVSSEEATVRLYGPVFESSDPISVYVGSSSRNSHSVFALWYGPQCKRNCAFTLEDSTEARAGIMVYIIHAFCYWAGDNKTRGWTCANGDDLCDAVGWLALRRATLKFRWVLAHASPPNGALRDAKNTAKRALAGEALVFDSLPPPDPDWTEEIPRLDIRKVSTTLHEASEPKAVVLLEIDVEEVIDPDLIHHGRKR